MPTVKYPKNPNIDTAFVEQEDGTKNRALMTAPQDISTLEYPNNPNSTKGYVTIDGKKQRVILTADITGSGGGGGGSGLPDQTGHSGEFLTTDGTDASWAAVDALPSQTGNAGKFLTTDGVGASWSDKPIINKAVQSNSCVINTNPSSTTVQASGQYNTMLGFGARVNNTSANYNAIFGYGANVSGAKSRNVIMGYGAESYANNGTAVGNNARINANNAIQVGNIDGSVATNNDANTFKVANANGNFEIMSADGTIPEARLADTTNAQQGDVLTLDANGDAVWQAASGGTQIQYSTMPDATENAGRIVQYVGDSSNVPNFTVNNNNGVLTITDPVLFLNMVNSSLIGNTTVQAGNIINVNCNEMYGNWFVTIILYDDQGTQLDDGGIQTTTLEATCGITASDPSNTNADVDVVSIGSSYTNGYFYKSVVGGASGLQFLCNTTKIEIVDPTLFITSVNNAMMGGTQVVDGTYFDITCNNDGNGWTFNINIQAPDGQGGVLEDAGDLYTSLDPATDIGLVVNTASNFFQTYAVYTSDTSEPHFYNYNPTDFSITDLQVFMDFVETLSSVTLQSDDDVHLDLDFPSGGVGIDVNVGIVRNGNVIFNSLTTVNSGDDIGMNININVIPTNVSFMFIAAGSAGGYQWEQVNVQPITVTADSIAPTTGLADGNYKLQLTITDGVPTLSWVAE